MVVRMNLDKMSLTDLVELERKVKVAISSARERERVEVKEKVEELIRNAGFSLDELFTRGRGGNKGKTVAPKYANPANPAETWSGRGRKPNWLVARINKGASIEEFAI
ncbi:MAG: H-NS histone family protein [Hyphomicrobiaceae bacterium]|nr:H-NS histone family protein [Hyphomicrobiaceae bacterium]